MNESLPIILEHKLTFLDTIAMVGISWWVSATVFCASIIAVIYKKRSELRETPRVFHWLQLGLYLFFFSIVLFGVFLMNMTSKLNLETIEIIKIIDNQQSTSQLTNINFGEFTTVYWGLAIGTSSFVLIVVAWVLLSNWILAKR